MLNWLSKFKTDWLSGEALNEWRIYWQTDFATERGTGWPINYLDDYQIGWWINWKTDCLIDWLIDWLLDQMINWLFSLLTPWPTNWLTDSQVQYILERYYYFFFHPGISSKLEERPSAITDMQTKSVMPDPCRQLCLHTHCHEPIKKASWCWGMEWNLSICKPESSISILQSIPCSYFKKL